MKRTVLFLFTALMVLSLASCKKDDSAGKSYGEAGKILVNGNLFDYTRGHLGEVLDGVLADAGDPDAIESLVWKGGSISGEDIDYLRSKLKKSLKEADLREASFFVSSAKYATGLETQAKASVESEHDVPIALFRDFTKLERVALGRVGQIRSFSISNCPVLKDFSVEKVKEIGYCAFITSGIEEIRFPEGLTNFKEEAFYGAALRKVDLPSTVTAFFDNTFICYKKTSGLVEVVCRAKTPPVVTHGTELNDQGNVFNRVRDDLVIRVPKGSVDAYKNAPLWSEHAAAITAIE